MYATATVSGVAPCMDALKAFMLANGWTVDTDQSEGLGRRITVHKISGFFVHFRSLIAESGINVGVLLHGIQVMISRTNDTSSFNANNEYSYLCGVLVFNPTVNSTYHFCSTPDGNCVNMAVTGKMIGDQSLDYAMFAGFGTSINKTDTLNDGWYMYAQNAVASNPIDATSAYNMYRLGQDGGNVMMNARNDSNVPLFGMYTTTTGYMTGSGNNMYDSIDAGGARGIMSYYTSINYGVFAFKSMQRYTASSEFANSTLIPSFVIMRSSTVGYNIVGTLPGFWSSNVVPRLYKNGQSVMMGGNEYVVFIGAVFEVHR